MPLRPRGAPPGSRRRVRRRGTAAESRLGDPACRTRMRASLGRPASARRPETGASWRSSSSQAPCVVARTLARRCPPRSGGAAEARSVAGTDVWARCGFPAPPISDRADAATTSLAETAGMSNDYAVVWRENGGPPQPGRLELEAHALRLEGGGDVRRLSFAGMTEMRIGRLPDERLA